jgi:hypothetical protein
VPDHAIWNIFGMSAKITPLDIIKNGPVNIFKNVIEELKKDGYKEL